VTTTAADPSSIARIVGTVAIGLACSSLPLFLTGALSTRIGADIGITTAGLGVAVAAFFLGGAVASVPGGRLADRYGSSAALRGGFAIATLCALAIGGVVDRNWLLVLTLFLGGTGVALVDTSGARAFAAAVPLQRQGFAFGIKEASIPSAALVAGATLPLLGDRFGWRPAFVGAAVLAAVAGLSVPSRLDAPRGPTPTPAAATAAIARPAEDPQAGAGPVRTAVAVSSLPLVALAVAAALGGGAAASSATFLVRSSEEAGLTASAAGLLLAVASGVSVATRLGSGVLADRLLGAELRLVAALLAVGTVGQLGLASDAAPLLLPGAILALGGGWGWTGLMFLAAIRIDADRPARAAGIVLAGLAIGGTLGPIAIGVIAERAGFPVAWLFGASAMAVACVVTLLTDRRSSDARSLA
jgi:MFS family permease